MVLKIPMFNSSPDEGISNSTISNFKVILKSFVRSTYDCVS